MDYICRKQLSLSGEEFLPGNVIPGEKILGSRVRALKTSGYISEISDDVEILNVDPMQFAESIGVVISHTDEGLPITTAITSEQLQSVFDYLMLGAKEAASKLDEEVDETVLEVLKTVDSRKTVKEAAEKQLMTISSLKQ